MQRNFFFSCILISGLSNFLRKFNFKQISQGFNFCEWKTHKNYFVAKKKSFPCEKLFKCWAKYSNSQIYYFTRLVFFESFNIVRNVDNLPNSKSQKFAKTEKFANNCQKIAATNSCSDRTSFILLLTYKLLLTMEIFSHAAETGSPCVYQFSGTVFFLLFYKSNPLNHWPDPFPPPTGYVICERSLTSTRSSLDY